MLHYFQKLNHNFYEFFFSLSKRECKGGVVFSLGLAGKMRIRGQIPARLHTLYGYFTVFERVKTHTYGGVRLMLIFLELRGPSIKDVDNKEGG